MTQGFVGSLILLAWNKDYAAVGVHKEASNAEDICQHAMPCNCYIFQE